MGTTNFNPTELETIGKLFGTKNIENGILFAEIDSYRYNVLRDMNTVTSLRITGVLSYILITHGELEINVDNKIFKCSHKCHNFIELYPFNELCDLKISEDFKGYLLAISKTFMDESMSGKRYVSLSKLMSLRLKPVYDFTSQEMQLMIGCIQKVERNFTRDSHLFMNEIIKYSVLEFLFEATNIILTKESLNNKTQMYNRKEDICSRFFELILIHCKKEHDVTFYADSMCITSQYLTKTLKQILGKSAGKIMADVIITEAIVMLRSHENSIQQVADALNFSDQSSFGKFFKKHVGVSPAKFRKKI